MQHTLASLLTTPFGLDGELAAATAPLPAPIIAGNQEAKGMKCLMREAFQHTVVKSQVW
jgi:hypothetical protein